MSLPFVSVIVPVLNEESCISDCLRSLLQLDYPRERLEIIVVDNGSTDRTLELVRPFPVRLIHECKPGSYAARNAGARLAKGEILAFTDADCVVEPGWVREMVRVFEQKTVGAVLGVASGINDNLCAELGQRLWEEWRRSGLTGIDVRRADTRNFAIRASLLREQGFFRSDVPHSGDWELGARLHSSGIKIVLAPDVCVGHRNLSDLMEVSRRRERQGYVSYRISSEYDDDFARTYFEEVVEYRLVKGLIRIDNRKSSIGAIRVWLLVLRLLRRITELPLKLLLHLHWRGKVSLYLFRLWNGLSCEIGILRARREHLARGQRV